MNITKHQKKKKDIEKETKTLKILPVSWVSRITIITASIVVKVIYKFNVIQNIIPTRFF